MDLEVKRQGISSMYVRAARLWGSMMANASDKVDGTNSRCNLLNRWERDS